MANRLLYLIFLAAALQSAHAQMRIGVGGGINAGSIFQKSYDGLLADSYAESMLQTPAYASLASAIAEWRTPSGLFFRSGLSLRSIGGRDEYCRTLILICIPISTYPSTGITFDRRTVYVQAPLQLGYSRGRFNFSTGPYAGMRISESQQQINQLQNRFFASPTPRWDYGWSGAVGIEVGKLLYQIEYLRGLRNISDHHIVYHLGTGSQYNNFLSASVI